IAGAPWDEAAVDLIGPWPISTPHGILEFFALTCIDTATNHLEIAWIFEKSSNYIATHFEHIWLSQHPKPMRVHRANAICKQSHQTVATLLKTLLLAQPSQTYHQAMLLVDNTLATDIYALKSMVLTTLQAAP
ncbi:hypothetical protein ACHAXS_000871, partial [Conticribra weissflogii]